MAVGMDLVKKLRDISGAGMMDCKNALEEAEGDLDKAFTILREKGIAKASKRAGRATGQGVVERISVAQCMKRLLLWSFQRGSVQYDVICVVILAFIFITPPAIFNDRPEFVRISDDQAIRQTSDDGGHTVFTVKVNTEQAAVDRLKAMLGGAVTISRTEPVYDTTGALVAYSIWIER